MPRREGAGASRVARTRRRPPVVGLAVTLALSAVVGSASSAQPVDARTIAWVAPASAVALSPVAAQAVAAQVVPVGGPPVTGVDGGGAEGAPVTEPATTAAPPPTPAPVQAVGAVTTSSLVAPGQPTVSVPATAPVPASVATLPETVPAPAPTAPITASPGASTPAITATTRPAATPVAGAASSADLRSRIDTALATSKAGSIGVFVNVDGLGAVYQRDADGARIPASTQKIYVTGTALLVLGGDFRYATEVRTSTAVGADGVLLGDLVVRASGDPSFGAGDLKTLADGVAKSGIRSVQGGLVIDDSHFDAVHSVASWKPSFTPGEVGVLGAFAVDGNHRNEADPGIANLERFRAALKAKGIVVTGASRRGALGLGGPVVSTVKSAPLRDLVNHTLKKSDNTYAEMFAKELGAVDGTGTTAAGVAAIAKEFARLGLTPPVQVDGSGLSTLNRSTARGEVQWLQKLAASSVAADLRSALPIACVDGTLRSRMCKTAAAAKVDAKTGALDNVVGISGYTTTASGRAVTFSMLFNAVPSAARARAAADQALAAIAAATI